MRFSLRRHASARVCPTLSPPSSPIKPSRHTRPPENSDLCPPAGTAKPGSLPSHKSVSNPAQQLHKAQPGEARQGKAQVAQQRKLEGAQQRRRSKARSCGGVADSAGALRALARNAALLATEEEQDIGFTPPRSPGLVTDHSVTDHSVTGHSVTGAVAACPVKIAHPISPASDAFSVTTPVTGPATDPVSVAAEGEKEEWVGSKAMGMPEGGEGEEEEEKGSEEGEEGEECGEGEGQEEGVLGGGKEGSEEGEEAEQAEEREEGEEFYDCISNGTASPHASLPLPSLLAPFSPPPGPSTPSREHNSRPSLNERLPRPEAAPSDISTPQQAPSSPPPLTVTTPPAVLMMPPALVTGRGGEAQGNNERTSSRRNKSNSNSPERSLSPPSTGTSTGTSARRGPPIPRSPEVSPDWACHVAQMALAEGTPGSGSLSLCSDSVYSDSLYSDADARGVTVAHKGGHSGRASGGGSTVGTPSVASLGSGASPLSLARDCASEFTPYPSPPYNCVHPPDSDMGPSYSDTHCYRDMAPSYSDAHCYSDMHSYSGMPPVYTDRQTHAGNSDAHTPIQEETHAKEGTIGGAAEVVPGHKGVLARAQETGGRGGLGERAKLTANAGAFGRAFLQGVLWRKGRRDGKAKPRTQQLLGQGEEGERQRAPMGLSMTSTAQLSKPKGRHHLIGTTEITVSVSLRIPKPSRLWSRWAVHPRQLETPAVAATAGKGAGALTAGAGARALTSACPPGLLAGPAAGPTAGATSKGATTLARTATPAEAATVEAEELVPTGNQATGPLSPAPAAVAPTAEATSQSAAGAPLAPMALPSSTGSTPAHQAAASSEWAQWGPPLVAAPRGLLFSYQCIPEGEGEGQDEDEEEEGEEGGLNEEGEEGEREDKQGGEEDEEEVEVDLGVGDGEEELQLPLEEEELQLPLEEEELQEEGVATAQAGLSPGPHQEVGSALNARALALWHKAVAGAGAARRGPAQEPDGPLSPAHESLSLSLANDSSSFSVAHDNSAFSMDHDSLLLRESYLETLAEEPEEEMAVLEAASQEELLGAPPAPPRTPLGALGDPGLPASTVRVSGWEMAALEAASEEELGVPPALCPPREQEEGAKGELRVRLGPSVGENGEAERGDKESVEEGREESGEGRRGVEDLIGFWSQWLLATRPSDRVTQARINSDFQKSYSDNSRRKRAAVGLGATEDEEKRTVIGDRAVTAGLKGKGLRTPLSSRRRSARVAPANLDTDDEVDMALADSAPPGSPGESSPEREGHSYGAPLAYQGFQGEVLRLGSWETLQQQDGFEGTVPEGRLYGFGPQTHTHPAPSISEGVEILERGTLLRQASSLNSTVTTSGEAADTVPVDLAMLRTAQQPVKAIAGDEGLGWPLGMVRELSGIPESEPVAFDK